MPKAEEEEVRESETRLESAAAQRVLEAASELFYERGIWATGVDAIVEHSGVTKMTLYKHFGSKDELVAAYLRRRDELWRGWLTEAVRERAETPKEELLAVFDALGSWLEGEVEGFRGCAFVNAASEIAEPDHPARTVALEEKRWMREYLEELSADAGAKDPEALSEQLMLLFEGATVSTTLKSTRAPALGARNAAEKLIEIQLGERRDH